MKGASKTQARTPKPATAATPRTRGPSTSARCRESSGRKKVGRTKLEEELYWQEVEQIRARVKSWDSFEMEVAVSGEQESEKLAQKGIDSVSKPRNASKRSRKRQRAI